MKITRVSAVPMSAPVPKEKRHRTDLGTKIKSDATLIRVEADNGRTGIGAVARVAADRRILEVTQGYMPIMWELFDEPFDIRPDGTVHAPGPSRPRLHAAA